MNRGGETATASREVARGTYFFLSYAHSAPTSEIVDTDADHWVSVLYHDLHAQVRHLVGPTASMDIGFFDALLPPGSDWKAALVDALGTAEVFVPLYSPGYLSRSWPMSERESFRRRLAASSIMRRDRHVVPVLWTPLPSSDHVPDLGEALGLGAGIPAYADNGLRALCMLAPYREQYLAVVRRLARQIVDVAENAPLGPARAPVPWVTSGPASTDTPFVVAVVAPTVADLPPNRSARTYGDSRVQWRPFAQAQALAESAATVAERLGLVTRIVDLHTGRTLLNKYPGILLIDPWIVAGAGGEEALASIGPLPEWVTPLIVVDRGDGQYADVGMALTDRVTDILRRMGAPRVKRAREIAEFVQIMPTLVSEARRQYLRKPSPKDRYPKRPRLAGHDPSPPPPARKKTDD